MDRALLIWGVLHFQVGSAILCLTLHALRDALALIRWALTLFAAPKRA